MVNRRQPVPVRAELGMQSISARVYGCCGARSTSSVRPSSTSLPAEHHRHPVGQPADDPEIMRDEQDAHAEFALQLPEQIHDLPLHGGVERGGRFVGDEQLRTARQRHGDDDALRHAAAEFVRIGAQTFLGFGDADFRRVRARSRRRARGGWRARRDGAAASTSSICCAHGEHGVERRRRVLENVGDLAVRARRATLARAA